MGVRRTQLPHELSMSFLGTELCSKNSMHAQYGSLASGSLIYFKRHSREHVCRAPMQPLLRSIDACRVDIVDGKQVISYPKYLTWNMNFMKVDCHNVSATMSHCHNKKLL